jgi:hypothetical protein
MATLTTLSVALSTTVTTTSASYVNAAGTATGVLGSGVDYLVFYRASIANDGSGFEGAARFALGPSGTNVATTVLGEVISESMAPNLAEDGTELQGVCRVTGNGSDVLKMQLAAPGGSTARIGGVSIVAIDLTPLVEGVDYFFDGTNSGTNEVAGAGGTFGTLRSVNFSLPDAGDYLVFMSAEAIPNASGGSSSDAAQLQPSVAGTTPSPDPNQADGYYRAWAADVDVNSHCFMKLLNAAAGSNNFALNCRSRSAGNSDFRRSRIAVLRAATFDQVVNTEVAAGNPAAGTTTTSSSYVDVPDMDTTYTPNQAEDVIVFSYCTLGADARFDPVGTQLRNDTDGVNLVSGMGERPNAGGYVTGADVLTTFCAAVETLGTVAARTYKLQLADIGGAGFPVAAARDRIDADSSEAAMVILSMEFTPSGGDQAAVFFGTNA